MKEKDVRRVRLIEDGEDLDSIVADSLVRLIHDCVKRTGRARLALSFDDRDMPLYDLLSSDRYRGAAPWERVDLFFTHERAVAPEHEDSRYGRAKRSLMTVGVLENRVHRMRSDEGDLEQAAQRYEAALLSHKPTREKEVAPLDLVLIGLGLEGRIAGLEPDSPALFLSNCLVAPAKLEADSVRCLTLTPSAMSSAAHIWVLARGTDIATTVHEVLEGDYEPNVHPVQAIRPKTGEMVWFVDAGAAQRLAVASKEFRTQVR